MPDAGGNNMIRIAATFAAALLALSAGAAAAKADTIEPRSLTWNIVSDQEMSSLCRRHGQSPSCAGLAAWDQEFQSCVIWTRPPRDADDLQRWRLVHHELRHCQQGAFHS
jgi:hypothetical protein